MHVLKTNIFSMQNEWLGFGYYGRQNKVGRPHIEWVDDIVDWCRTILQEVSHSAQDRLKWRQIMEEASDSDER